MLLLSRKFLSALSFRVMTKSDLEGFAGCESPVPLIAEALSFTVIIDGSRCEIYDENGQLVDSTDDICKLSY
jgi:hypothetical protein